MNVSRGFGFYAATGLTSNAEYTISTQTVDKSGNINLTWVNHTAWTASPAGEVTPPASVTGLVNTTYLQTSINWTWTDPTDADFSHVMVYLKDTFLANVTKGVGFNNATGLTPNTQYTISTRTVDTSGNINQTWVTHTTRTAPLPWDTTPPASVTGLVNSTYVQTSIRWTWKEPSDPDFDRVMVYLNDVFKANVTKSRGSKMLYDATGFTAGTEYTISTHTVDKSGNVNLTWVNHTAWTAPVSGTNSKNKK